MLHDLPIFRARCQVPIGLEDITMVLAVRLHEGNTWAAERLAAMGSHYRTLAPTLVVDFGSAPPFREQLQGICADNGFSYVFEDDSGVFSLSRARNIGARASRTKLIFFNDVDCFGGADFFERLVAHANHIEMGSYLEQIINLPVYHLGDADTEQVLTREVAFRGDVLMRVMSQMTYAKFDPKAYSFVDPSSNFFVIRREFFELVGGYNEGFRGHGSEDFEFFLRLAHFTQQFPLPAAPAENVYSPINPSFFRFKRYRGFRRFMELMAFQTECAGLRIAHLNHPRGSGAWYSEGDRGKKRLATELSSFLHMPSRLIDRDWLPRPKTALVLLRHERQYQYFLPLRLQGYRLHLMFLGDSESESRATALLEQGQLSTVAVFNPYMGSHKELAPWVDRARAASIPLTVIDRGMLPESWFFAADMPYADPDYQQLDLDSVALSADQLAVASDYAAKLRQGGATLEQNGDFDETIRRRSQHDDFQKTILVPLQLPDDVAVTRFTEGYGSYADFSSSLDSVARAHPQIRFLVKTHPLSNAPLTSHAKNIVPCGRADNIHALIELSDVVICYNSGVGFLALVHQKPLITIGNAFYNIAGAGHRAGSLQEALEKLSPELAAPSAKLMNRYLAWHLFDKYAFFKATSQLQELAKRQAHHYSALAPYQLPGGALTALRASSDHTFQARSYAGGKLGIAANPLLSAALSWDERLPVVRKLRKLVRDPRAFARDSRLGRKLLGRR